MEASEIIEQARLRSPLTRAELARRADTTRAALLEYEKGTRTPRFDTLVKVLDATGTELTITYPSPPLDAGSGPSLAGAAGRLGDDAFTNWRLLISDFVANDFVPASSAERAAMLAPEPVSGQRPHWRVFLAALAEHLAFHAEVPCPGWATDVTSDFTAFWYPVHGTLASQRAAAMAWSPASFRRRRILVDGRELPLVTR